MESDIVTPSVEQCCVIKLLVKKEVKPVEILCRLNAQCEEEILSYAKFIMIYTKSFLKTIRNSRTYCMLMLASKLMMNSHAMS
jgi:hypothetical protein